MRSVLIEDPLTFIPYLLRDRKMKAYCSHSRVFMWNIINNKHSQPIWLGEFAYAGGSIIGLQYQRSSLALQRRSRFLSLRTLTTGTLLKNEECLATRIPSSSLAVTIDPFALTSVAGFGWNTACSCFSLSRLF